MIDNCIVLLCVIILAAPLPISESLAHNSSIIRVPIAQHSITLDGSPMMKEWDDAFQANFTSSGRAGTVIVYLKYDLSDRAMDGAFIIPDKTPSTVKGKLDQISFLFDVTHTAAKHTDPNDHLIVFGRDKESEYYLGKQAKESGYNSIQNSTMNGHTIVLHNPFSRADFNIVSNPLNWTGEFKIYFKDEPRLYGFAIQQTDYYSPIIRHRYFINYPDCSGTNAGNPSTWGDIQVAEFNKYLKNIQTSCPGSYSLNKSEILCINSINPNEIEENSHRNVIVDGRLADFIKNTGIHAQLSVNILNSSKKLWYFPQQEHVNSTLPLGDYHFLLPDVNLPKGKYFVSITTPSQYSGLNTTSDLSVKEHILSVDESITRLGVYFGVIAAGLGLLAFVPKIKQYFIEKKQRKNLYSQMMKINEYISDITPVNKSYCLERLKERRFDILNLLNYGEISEEHYMMLDNKISEYEEKLTKD